MNNHLPRTLATMRVDSLLLCPPIPLASWHVDAATKSQPLHSFGIPKSDLLEDGLPQAYPSQRAQPIRLQHVLEYLAVVLTLQDQPIKTLCFFQHVRFPVPLRLLMDDSHKASMLHIRLV